MGLSLEIELGIVEHPIRWRVVSVNFTSVTGEEGSNTLWLKPVLQLQSGLEFQEPIRNPSTHILQYYET